MQELDESWPAVLELPKKTKKKPIKNKQQCLSPENMACWLKIIHRPCWELFHVGAFYPSFQQPSMAHADEAAATFKLCYIMMALWHSLIHSSALEKKSAGFGLRATDFEVYTAYSIFQQFNLTSWTTPVRRWKRSRMGAMLIQFRFKAAPG